MEALILLADGFETTEALATYDIFKRSHQINPTLVSISQNKEVISSQGIAIEADAILDEVNTSIYDMLILPGGKKGVENLGNCQKVAFIVKSFFANPNKEVHAICAAPSILGKLGLLEGRKYTCFPGFEGPWGKYTGDPVTVDKELITGKSMGYTIPFALAIVERHYGKEIVEAIEKGTLGK